ncbi:peptide chain release factor 1-like, mitochondrial [Branchiostoma lanceolatum]|uniref:peptide chain release factor 1-like, mitochondrial n=1 Tax=Branchiostoma lanceolatum TaxID=7740 RepID=UPI0034547176
MIFRSLRYVGAVVHKPACSPGFIRCLSGGGGRWKFHRHPPVSWLRPVTVFQRLIPQPTRRVITNTQTFSTAAKERTFSLQNEGTWGYLQRLVTEGQTVIDKLQTEEKTETENKRLTKRWEELRPIVEKVQQVERTLGELADIEKLLAGLEDGETEMRDLALQEKESYENDMEHLEDEILTLLVPADEADENDIILEVVAGVGGQEAMLFTSDVFEMYCQYAAYKNWHMQVLTSDSSTLGGLRHATASIKGLNAYKLLKLEAGVHRVQRVPRTEKSGRVHTSTMTVAVLPQPKEIDNTWDKSEFKIETKKASGAGGQHVNKTESAVRIVHIPTGVAVECQQERSQIRNRAIAMQTIQARLYQRKLDQQRSQRQLARQQQMGTAGRSEKIRTYNFTQDRVTDHRAGINMFNLQDFLIGGDKLDEMIHTVQQHLHREEVLLIMEQDTIQQKKL